MPIIPPTGGGAPQTQIPYWGSFIGQQTFNNPAQNPAAQQFLSALQKYDPNAKFVDNAASMAGDNNQVTPENWTLQANLNKVPGYNNDLVDMNKGDYNVSGWSPTLSGGANIEGGGQNSDYTNPLTFQQFMENRFNDGNYGGQLINPNMIGSASGALGQVTARQNIKQDNSGFLGMLGKIAPYAVMGLIGGGLGSVIGPALGGLMPGLGSTLSGGIGKILGNTLMSNIVSGGQAGFNPMSLTSLIPGLPGVQGITSSINSALGPVSQLLPYLSLINNARGAASGNPMAMFNLARLGYNTFSGH